MPNIKHLRHSILSKVGMESMLFSRMFIIKHTKKCSYDNIMESFIYQTIHHNLLLFISLIDDNMSNKCKLSSSSSPSSSSSSSPSSLKSSTSSSPLHHNHTGTLFLKWISALISTSVRAISTWPCTLALMRAVSPFYNNNEKMKIQNKKI